MILIAAMELLKYKKRKDGITIVKVIKELGKHINDGWAYTIKWDEEGRWLTVCQATELSESVNDPLEHLSSCLATAVFFLQFLLWN